MEPLDESTRHQDTSLTPLAITYLKDTVPWVRFFGIFGIVISVIYLILGAVSLFTSQMAGIVFIIVSAFYFFMCNLLNQYGRNISHYIKDKEPVKLEIAFRKQQTFWMISGILTIIMIACLILFMVFAGGTFMQLLQQNRGTGL